METANFLASIWGIFLVVVPLSLLISPKKIQDLFALVESETNVYIYGMISFVLGAMTVLSNNVWAYNWKTIVTVLGWLAIIKGCCGLFRPQCMIKYCNMLKNKEWLSYVALVAVFIGLIVTYFGFTGN